MQPLLLGAGLTLGLASPIAAQCGAQKVLPLVYESGAQFGSSLSFVEGGMVVGAWLSSVFAAQGGAVFLAEGAPGSFSIAVPLGPADASPGQRFGRAVDGAAK